MQRFFDFYCRNFTIVEMLSDLNTVILTPKKLCKFILCLFICSFILGIISYFFIDQPLALFFRREDNSHLWLFAREITNIGLGQHYFIFAVLFLVYLYYLAQRIPWLGPQPNKITWYKSWAWNFLAALSSSGLLLRLFKFIFGRQRPSKSFDSNPENFQFFSHDWDFHSFPSGHTQVLFAVAVMICILDPKRKYLWLTLAFVFSFTRVMTYSHFLSDVIGGAFTGLAGAMIGLYLMNRYSRHRIL